MQGKPQIQLKDIRKLFEAQGYRLEAKYETSFRYGYDKTLGKTLILGAKIGIPFPTKTKIPFNLVDFYVSIVTQPMWFNENTQRIITHLSSEFYRIMKEIEPLVHEFNLGHLETRLWKIFTKYIPEIKNLDSHKYANEKDFLAIIRENNLKVKDTYTENCLKLSEDILDMISNFKLKPTFRRPPEFSNQYSEENKGAAVFFQSQNPNAFLIEEPGSISYTRDFIKNHTWVRTGFECHTPFILYDTFSDSDFSLSEIIKDWISYCQGLVRPIVEIIESPVYDYHLLTAFNPISYLEQIPKDNLITGLYLPRLIHVKKGISDFKEENKKLILLPPQSLEEINSIEEFKLAEKLVGIGSYKRAYNLLHKIKQVLKKYSHNQGQVRVLLLLFEISKNRRDFSGGIAQLYEALKIAKNGDIQPSHIMKIHANLAFAHGMGGNISQSEGHFKIAERFLTGNTSIPGHEPLLVEMLVSMIKVNIEQRVPGRANDYFKYLHRFASKSPEAEFLYYYWRIFYYQLINSPNKQYQALQKAMGLYTDIYEIEIPLEILHAKIIIYKKQAFNKGIQILETLKSNTIKKPIQNKALLQEIYQMEIDAYKALNKTEELQKVTKELQEI